MLSSIHKPNFKVLGPKMNILPIFLWSFYYFENGVFGGPLRNHSKISFQVYNVLLLSSMHKPYFTVLDPKIKILAIFF